MARVPLGVFELEGPLARGGMASVWHGTHPGYGIPVAVKVLTAEAFRDPELREALHEEVRAVAGLRHPNIIWVHDAGTVGAETERATEGRLPQGSPWYAMERLDGGTLRQRVRRLTSFEHVRDLLVDLLDALAHAHSRDVLHRDLKPGNLLFTADGALKLADFGMALFLSDQAAAAQGGTPAWAAPEQCTGASAEQGPWTDLYAVGCLAWALCCGRRPFTGSAEQLVTQHLQRAPPRLDPRFGVPDGLEGWIHVLMQKAPEARYQRAADAAWALDELPRTYDGVAPGGTTIRIAPAAGLDADHTPTVCGGPVQRAQTPMATRRTPRRGRVPSSWRGPAMPHPPLQLLGAGLGLFGLRCLPLVGRHDERDALWEALRRVADTSHSGAVLLRGPSGFGKSRLAEWLARRVHELGAAEVFRATHNPHGAPTDGLAGLVARCCRAAGLPDARLFSHLLRQTRSQGSDDAEWDAAALRQLIRPVTPSDAPDELVVRFSSAEQVHRTVLRRIAQQRDSGAALVWLDDVQWGPEALALVARALERREATGPVLFVLTVQDEALALRATATDLLDSLEPRLHTLHIGPLPDGARPHLLQQMLHLTPDVAEEVERRTQGNPLFATQLVGDWVQRGLLTPGREGFELPPGEALPLPGTLAAAWRERVERLLEGGRPGWREALELAATLGQDVDVVDWRALCAGDARAQPRGLVGALVGARLAQLNRDGRERSWSFVHGMVREAVMLIAASRGRAVELHTRVAEHLAGQGPEVAERRARHLEAAGRPGDAIDAWFEARTHLFVRDRRRSKAAQDRCEVLLAEPGQGGHPLAPRIRLRQFQDAFRAGEHAAARRAIDPERTRTGTASRVAVLLADAALAGAREDHDEQGVLLSRACREARGVPLWRAEALEGRSFYLHRTRGEVLAARDLLRKACALRADAYGLALLVQLELETGGTDAARALCVSLEEMASKEGAPAIWEIACGSAGLVAATLGDLQGAARAFRRAIDYHNRFSTSFNSIHRANLVEMLLRLGEAEQANEALEPLLANPAGEPYHAWLIAALDLVVAAHLGDWRRYDAIRVGPGPYSDADQGRLLLAAGDCASEAGHRDRAHRAWQIAAAAFETADADGLRAARARLCQRSP